MKKRPKYTFSLHHWCGLIAGIFLLAISISGVGLVFEEEIDRAFYARHFDLARPANSLILDNSFEISGHAVKQQARVFKSILKLDKNFHIYIHGNKELIERGTDPDGRKFYKIYYEREA